MGLGGVTVALSGVSSSTAVTDDSGQYAFTGLRMGSYSVEISGFDTDEVGFSNTASAVTVGVGESKIVSFDGTYLRTAGIQGRVSVEGEGLEGVNVSLTGGPDGVSETTTTDASGQYSFARLRAGDYQVGISGYNTDDYEFERTSRNVTVALGETANVPFEGVLLRTSGISGRVSVEGMGLEGITVTLSMADADDMTTMTDAGGTYAFAGLAAGAYTVSIAVEGDAYVFETMSMDVEVADDATAIVNFDGMHAATASVSGVVFIDEATKNDMLDEGEHPVAQAGIPVALVGPGVNDQMLGATDEMGAFTFAGLKAGTYQLVFTGAAALPEGFAFGGSAIGYTIPLGVGEAHMQNLPIDITHTTINFSVMLKSGDETGDALPGATVDVYADMAGETKIGSGETDDMGMTAITVERDRASGNMVYAGVMAPDGFGVDGDMQMVAWDPQYPVTAASNSQDIVNLNAEVSFAGAAVTTDMEGSGEPLSGWGIDVTMMGDDGEMIAVEGAPEMLDDEGMGSITVMAESAADLPMTYYVTFDADQEGEDADGNELDGGESYETVDTVMYTHTGLSVDTEMDAGTVTARYTTQTLKVYVYREVDQVPGFTGNIGARDESTTEGVSLSLRHATPNDRRSRIDPDVWEWDTSGSDRTVWIDDGEYIFRGLPAEYNIFVVADPGDDVDNVEILDPDNLAAFENPEENGIMGGAFGPDGGWGHTVSLCPLTKVDPTGQDFGECASFAFVNNYEVAGHVKKMRVKKDDNDSFEDVEAINVPGIAVGLTPVTGKNIAGEAEAVETLERAVRTRGENAAGTSIVDERQDLVFGRMAEGVYDVSVPDGWEATVNGDEVGDDFRLSADAVVDVEELNEAIEEEDEDGPFHATDSVHVQVRPSTGTLYGIVTDEGGNPVEGVTVTVNDDWSGETDIDGRYIVDGYDSKRSARYRNRTRLFLTFSGQGYDTKRNNPDRAASLGGAQVDIDGAPTFAADDPKRLDVELAESTPLATVTGTVTDEDGDPVSGVDITVTKLDGTNALHNQSRIPGGVCVAKRIEDTGQRANEADSDGRGMGVDRACFRTGDDGTYELQIMVTEDDEDYVIAPSKDRTYFDDPYEEERLEVGDSEVGVNFEALVQGRIRGSVRNADGDGVEGATVTATAGSYIPSATTNSRGRFTIWVDGDDTYDVTAVHPDGYSFSQPRDAERVRIDPGETIDGLDFTAPTFAASGMAAMRDADDDGNYDGNLTVTWTAGTVPAGVTVTYQVQINLVGDDPDAGWTNLGSAVASTADPQELDSESLSGDAVDGEFMVRIESTSDDGAGTTVTVNGPAMPVDAVNPTATLTAAGRDATDDDELDLVWTANANASSDFRVVVEVDVTATRKEWVVVADNAFTVPSGSDPTNAERAASINLTTVGTWSNADGSGTTVVTAEMLAGAFRVAVESLQGTFDADDNPWTRSNVRDVAAK